MMSLENLLSKAPITFSSGRTCQLLKTADESLTARLSFNGDDSETMHSLRGAFSETVYIYGAAFENALSTLKMSHEPEQSPRVFSLGLGLGYVEILSSALALQHRTNLRGASFEAVPELIASFQAWLDIKNPTTPLEETLLPTCIYDDILMRTARLFDLNPDEIKIQLRRVLQNGDWSLYGPLSIAHVSSAQDSKDTLGRFNCIAFDAFSSKTTPDLWSREFLDEFLKNICAQTCVLSTYACTGHLKRALTNASFDLQIREGYASKRDSTLAIRHG